MLRVQRIPLAGKSNLTRKEVNTMTYEKPTITLIGNASQLIEDGHKGSEPINPPGPVALSECELED